MKKVLTIIYDMSITKEDISSIPFLKGFDIWNTKDGRTGEVIKRIQEVANNRELNGKMVRPKFFRDNKGILFKEEKPSKNYYIMPNGTNGIVIFRINTVGEKDEYEINTNNVFNMEVVVHKLKEK